MNTSWEKAKMIFDEALKLTPAERPLFLKQACSGDDKIFREVESLLQSFADDSFLETPACSDVAETLLWDASKFASGQILNHYKVVRHLGAGGMGEVYLATDTRLRRQVALKVLPSEFMLDPDRSRRFQQEAYAASALNHPNILTIHEIGEFENTSYIASEFIEGETLREKLIHQSVPLHEAVDIALQTASALAAAHESGIVHRDIKPENIMIRRDRLVKVLDFGLAKLTAGESVEADAGDLTRVKTATGVIMGTTAYMSPEQARGKVTDARSDIFSFGIVFYEMLAGQPPFAGETTSDIIAAILKSEPLPLGDHVSDIPAELECIVEKTLRKNRGERYQNINDLVIDLREIKQHLEAKSKLVRSASTKATPGETEATRIQPLATSSAEYLVGELKNHKLATFAVLLFLAVGGAALSYFTRGNEKSVDAPLKTIAVLPFKPLVLENRNEALEFGLADTLISKLSGGEEIVVRPLSAIRRYASVEQDPLTAGRELGVESILDGTIQNWGDRIRISAKLLRTSDGKQLWAGQFDEKFTDIFVVQDSISEKVIAALKIRLSGKEKKHSTENIEAYQLYVKGRYYIAKGTSPDLRASIPYFQQAIDIDPNYALAYTGLAQANGVLGISGDMPPSEAFPKGKAAAQKAIEIDDTLAEAHVATCMGLFWYEWDWSSAENHCRRALELDPNSADAHDSYAMVLSTTGRHAEALAEAKRSRELNPLDLVHNALEGQYLLHAGRIDEALDRLQKTSELEPNFPLPHLFAASAYVEKGLYAEAIAESRKEYELSGGNVTTFGIYALARSGNRDEARAELRKLVRLSATKYVPPYNIALAYNGLEMRNDALEWLEKGYEQRDPHMPFLKVEPKWNNLRSEPRFIDLMQHMKL
ncbi:MAG: protein kinase [Acidobacteriota bacterium]